MGLGYDPKSEKTFWIQNNEDTHGNFIAFLPESKPWLDGRQVLPLPRRRRGVEDLSVFGYVYPAVDLGGKLSMRMFRSTGGEC